MRNLFKRIACFIVSAAAAVTAMAVPASAAYERKSIPDNDATRFVDSMGAGWNLGNAFDAVDCPWVTDKMDLETGWCKAKTTKELIKTVKASGFKTIRVPVSWREHVDASFNIDKKWLDRVQEVIDWCLEEKLYVILNIHHDGEKGYYYPSSAEYKTSEKYIKAIWKQLSERFKDYGEELIFETINEPCLSGTDFQWYYNLNNVPSEVKDSLDCINKLNQAALDTIRAAGGKNKSRYVMIPGYDTDGTKKGLCSQYFKMPTDSVKNRLIATAHIYTLKRGEFKYACNLLYENFVSKGIPVVIGEYGLDTNGYKYGDGKASAELLGDMVEYARASGISAVIWDNNAKDSFQFIDRSTAKVTYQNIIDAVVKGGKPALSSSSSSGSSDKTTTSGNSTKPVLKAKVSQNQVTLSWNKVEGATKYTVYKYTGGKYKAVKKSMTGTKLTIKNLKSGTTYKYIVRAYVNGKWTTLSKNDLVSVKIK